MMSAPKFNGEHVMPALTYANKQIDQFIERGRLTFTELALIVEAIYMMSQVSGSLVFTYALVTRAKQLVLDERGHFCIENVNEGPDHMIPPFLRDLPFYVENKTKYEDIKAFVPLFSLGLSANTVVLKNTIWVQSRERSGIHLAILLGSQAMDATQVHDNRHASVTVPVVHLVKDVPVCSLIQLPAGTFDKVCRASARGPVTLQLRKGFAGNRSNHPEVVVKPFEPALGRDKVHAVVGDFWKSYSEYANKIALQNAKMPKHVIEAVTHTLINVQKSPADLSQLLF